MGAAPDFSLHLGEGLYCVIESDWSDTPQQWIDYHMMHVSLRDWPKGIARVRDKEGRECLGYPSTVHLRTPAAEISRIQVLDHREESGDEFVHYDQALVFTRADGYRFFLSAQLSIAGGLEFSDRKPSSTSFSRSAARGSVLGSALPNKAYLDSPRQAEIVIC